MRLSHPPSAEPSPTDPSPADSRFHLWCNQELALVVALRVKARAIVFLGKKTDRCHNRRTAVNMGM
jgi:hypothetical protein